jgi:hypothetical protein
VQAGTRCPPGRRPGRLAAAAPGPLARHGLGVHPTWVPPARAAGREERTDWRFWPSRASSGATRMGQPPGSTWAVTSAWRAWLVIADPDLTKSARCSVTAIVIRFGLVPGSVGPTGASMSPSVRVASMSQSVRVTRDLDGRGPAVQPHAPLTRREGVPVKCAWLGPL